MNDLDAAINEFKKNAGKSDSRESDFHRILEFFNSSAGIRGKTRLSEAKRNMIMLFDAMDKKHPTWGLSAYAENAAVLFLSEDGKSREESIRLFQGLLSQMRNESLTLETKKEAPKP
jgi:hypothetical protein